MCQLGMSLIRTSIHAQNSNNKPSGTARGLDFRLGIAEGAEDPIVEPGAAGFLKEVRADIFPHHLAALRHLEQPAVATLANQRVAVGEALRPGDVRAEKIEDRLVGVLPDD